MTESSAYPRLIALSFERAGRTLARYCYEVLTPAEERRAEDDARDRLWRDQGRFGGIQNLHRRKAEDVTADEPVIRLSVRR